MIIDAISNNHVKTSVTKKTMASFVFNLYANALFQQYIDTFFYYCKDYDIF